MLRNRILIGFLFVLSLVGISFYGGPVSYGFFIMVTLLPVISFVYLLFVRFRFRVYEKLEGKTFISNHPIPYYITLQNESFFAFAGVKIYFHSDFSSVFGLADGTEYELFPETGVTRDTTLFCKYRGQYPVGIKQLEITDFLRILRMRYQNPEPLTVSIQPDVITLTSLKSLSLSRVFSLDALRGKSVPDVTVRDYQTTDDPRHIHWKASARERKLMTKTFTGEEQKGVAVVLSTLRASEQAEEYLPVENRMLEIALALSRFFVNSAVPVRALHKTGTVSDMHMDGNASFDAYYRVLSNILFRKDCTDAGLFGALSADASFLKAKAVFLVLNTYDAQTAQMCRLLNQNGIPVIVYLVSLRAEKFRSPDDLPRTKVIPVPADVPLKEVL